MEITRNQKRETCFTVQECDTEPYRYRLPRSYALEPSVATGMSNVIQPAT